jgi:uncharacterized protein (TIGR03067 family)
MILMMLRNRIGLLRPVTGPALLLVVALWAGFSPGGATTRALGDDDKSSSEALKSLQGTWVSESDEIDARWTFEGDTLKASVNGIDYTCKVKVDAKAKPHATADFLINEGPEDAKGKTSQCIYKLDGKTLTLCVSLPGKDRPKEFESTEGEAFLLKLKGAEEKSSSEALKSFKGTWVTDNDEIDARWTFEGETLKASVNGIDYTCKVKVDAKAKPHATVDLVIDEGPEDAKGKTSQCIYKLDGDTLTICVSLPGKDRPKEFESAEGEAHLFKLKKEKAGEKPAEKKD